MKTKTITNFLVAGLLCLPINIAAQKMLDPEINPNLYRTEVIQSDMGLSSPLITYIYEDQYGYIWIGTQYGLDLYDGYAITQMNDAIADPVSTSFEWVWSIDEDRSGTLWVCSSKGLFRYDRLHHSFEMLLPNLDKPDSEDNIVYSIRQDSKDIYWLFTRGGLFSYNREENLFKDYKKDSIISAEHGMVLKMLLNWYNQIRFCEDHSGTIWIGTFNGLKKYDRKNDQFITFRHDPEDPESISGDRISCVIEDRAGTLWISVYSTTNQRFELNKIMDTENGVFTQYYHDRMDPQSLLSERLWPLYIDGDSNLWIGGNWGFSRYNYETDNFDNFRLPSYEVPGLDFEINKQIFRITEDSRGNLWMLTFNGIFSFDAATDRIVHYYYDPNGPKNLVPDIHATTIIEDQSGSVWVSGANRITKSDPLLKPFYATTGHRLGLDPEGEIRVMSLYYDDKGILWVGVDEYGLLKSSTFVPGHTHEFQLIHPDIRPYCFLRDHNGQLWMGTINIGLGKVNKHTNVIKWFPSNVSSSDGLYGSYVGMMYEDRRNIFWIATIDGGINIFHPERERFIPIINNPEKMPGLVGNLLVINEDQHGDMWFGSFNYGVSRLEITDGLADSIQAVFAGELERDRLKLKFRNFRNNPFDPHSLSGNQINDMHTDGAGRLWIGTTNGLNLFDETNEIFYAFTTADGLPDNCIFGMLEDDHGNLWLSNRKGICKVVLKDGIGEDLITSVHSYKKEDGLQGDMFYENTCQKTEDGWMFFGGIHGLTMFHPDSIKDNYLIPPVYITDILINEQSVYSREPSLLDTGLFETDKIELSYKQNFLAFEYLALNYSNAEQNQYKYMMEGLDRDWVEAGNRRYAEYRDLKPGEYTFRVLGSNDDGVWNAEGASLGIIIHPPWYRTMLAYILYVILVAVAIYVIIQWRTFRLRKDKEILEKKVKERTRTIEEQKGEIMDANTVLEEQKEELEQQKEELQITLDRLKETQTQLIQSEKLAALGGLVAGVAHEINTPVGISVTAASSLAEETQQMAEKYKENKISRSEFKDYLNTANQSAKLILANMERTASMVQSFKQVSVDQSTEQQRKFRLKEYTEDVIRSLYPRIKGKKVKINLEIDEQIELNSYPGAFSQILTNLVLNSVVHGFEKMDQGIIKLTARLEKKELQMEYHDNGKGIPAQNLDKVFDPFFTTNKKAGTGLGLHIVYNIVNQKLNGSITCSSEKEKGVSFRLKIPIQ